MSDAPSHGSSPPDDEPRTPAWLTALGVALFVAVGVAWAWSPSKHSPGAVAPSASVVAAPAPPAPPGGGAPNR